MNNMDISEMPFYIVCSKVYGMHLYKSYNDAFTAIEDSTAEYDEGQIYKMIIGPSYQDPSTELRMSYKKIESKVFYQ